VNARALVLGLALVALTAGGDPGGRRIERARVPAPRLGGAREVRVWLPPSYARGERRYPVVYLLHGFPGGVDDWFSRAHAAEIAAALVDSGAIPEAILVCPDGAHGLLTRTMFANAADGTFPLADFVARDLVAWTDSVYRTVAEPRARAIVGLSDGGTAAFNLVRDHGDVFGAAAAHSAEFRLRYGFGLRRTVGPEADAGPHLAALSPLETFRHRLPPPGAVLYFDCGLDDPALADNRAFHALLDSLHVVHTYREFPGTHTWSYWRAHLRESLIAVLGPRRSARDP